MILRHASAAQIHRHHGMSLAFFTITSPARAHEIRRLYRRLSRALGAWEARATILVSISAAHFHSTYTPVDDLEAVAS